MAWGAICAALWFLSPEEYRFWIEGIFTVIFSGVVSSYFYFDYSKTHKKRTPKTKFPPLTPQIPKQAKPIKSGKPKKLAFAKNLFFTLLEAFEVTFCLGIITSWANFHNFSPEYKRIRVDFIQGARNRPAEFRKRLKYFIEMTEKNKQFGFGGIEKYY